MSEARDRWLSQFADGEDETLELESRMELIAKMEEKQISPADPNCSLFGHPKDSKDTLPCNVRLDPSEAHMLGKIIELRMDPKYTGGKTSFVRHWVAFGIRETLKRNDSSKYAEAYEASLYMRQLREKANVIQSQLSFIEDLEKMVRQNHNNQEIIDYLQADAQGVYLNAAIPSIATAIKQVFPGIGDK